MYLELKYIPKKWQTIYERLLKNRNNINQIDFNQFQLFFSLQRRGWREAANCGMTPRCSVCT